MFVSIKNTFDFGVFIIVGLLVVYPKLQEIVTLLLKGILWAVIAIVFIFLCTHGYIALVETEFACEKFGDGHPTHEWAPAYDLIKTSLTYEIPIELFKYFRAKKGIDLDQKQSSTKNNADTQIPQDQQQLSENRQFFNQIKEYVENLFSTVWTKRTSSHQARNNNNT